MGPIANDEIPCATMLGDVPVKAECLPFTQIPHTTRLFLDFLFYSPKIRAFYPHSPRVSDWLKQETFAQGYDSGRRSVVCDVLARQNEVWGCSAKTRANIARFRAGAAAFVTGQQVGLFGGPVFALLKALTAVKLAEETSASGVDAVPVFWLATSDHDLAEVSHATFPGVEGTLQSLTSSSHGVEDAPVGTVVFDPEIERVVESAIALLGASPAADLLRDSYLPGETVGSAFARLYARLFADFGVILLDPSDAQLHTIAAPIYRAAIENAVEIDEALLARGRELESAGYHQQVKVTPSSTLLFILKDGARIPIHRRVNGHDTVEFLIQDATLSREELLARIEERPQDFSPNVLLRPVVQDCLLPTIAYTGGAAEVAYFAQAAVVYEKLLGRVTPIVPRFSATVIESRQKALLEKYGLELPEVFYGEDALREKLAAKTLSADLQSAFDRAGESLHQSLAGVREALARLDKTLVDAADNAGSKMQHQLESLRAKAARAELRHSEVLARHAQLLSNSLFPNKVLQEREIAGVYYLARYGVEFLNVLNSTLQLECNDHQVLTFA